jgi:hypothetical protein
MIPHRVTYRVELLISSTVTAERMPDAELAAWHVALGALVPETLVTRWLARQNLTVLAAHPLRIVSTTAINERHSS